MKKCLPNHTKVLLVIASPLIITLILFPYISRELGSAKEIHKQWIDSLISLQDVAASRGEFPVSALLIYKDSIIGSGYNTFRKLNDPLGHAEVNALRNAFEKYNYHQFRRLNRDSLIMLTSYEPCMMCKGIICHHEIRHIFYLKPKPLRKKIDYCFRNLRYYFKIRKIRAE
ncbi:MAG: nucleoside deaminase [Bacteroidales bacterium]|nr:nucleoside deaminase [Bacteroidales bacterium]